MSYCQALIEFKPLFLHVAVGWPISCTLPVSIGPCRARWQNAYAESLAWQAKQRIASDDVFAVEAAAPTTAVHEAGPPVSHT